MDEPTARGTRLSGGLRTGLKVVAGMVALAILVLVGIGARTVYDWTQPEAPVDEYAQFRAISFMEIDAFPLDGVPDGLPDLTVMVATVRVWENVGDGTLLLRVEGVTTPPLP